MSKFMPKIITIYLPQFYETEDNNKWWGKGFTDWVSVINSKKYFEGHDAPWKPLNNNYYDLSTHETMKMQAELAKKYGVDGFCFYHYYFENGKKELELPAENLLRWKDIDMPFCFNWASESWIRSWSHISGNVWSEKYEKEDDDCNSSSGVLVNQNYGNEYDWKAHFDYLLPFFGDKRYIKIDNKPVFIFYNPTDIKCLDKMVQMWRRLAVQSGLDGLYLIGANVNTIGSKLDASLIYEPRTAINRMNAAHKAKVNNGVRCFNYEDACNEVLKSKPYTGCKTYFMGISGYDDTPRRGNSGECLVGNSPKLFKNQIERLIEKTVKYGNEMLFINAWNEWGEGMYLEPDESHGFKYLDAINDAKKSVGPMVPNVGLKSDDSYDNEEIEKLQNELKKSKFFVNLLDRWLKIERAHKFSFSKLFSKYEINTVAIYGMAVMGKQVYEQLKEEGINAKYGIDRYVGQYSKDFRIIRPEEEYPSVDAIIITVYDTDGVYDMISRKSPARLFILEEIINYFEEQYEL